MIQLNLTAIRDVHHGGSDIDGFRARDSRDCLADLEGLLGPGADVVLALG